MALNLNTALTALGYPGGVVDNSRVIHHSRQRHDLICWLHRTFCADSHASASAGAEAEVEWDELLQWASALGVEGCTGAAEASGESGHARRVAMSLLRGEPEAAADHSGVGTSGDAVGADPRYRVLVSLAECTLAAQSEWTATGIDQIPLCDADGAGVAAGHGRKQGASAGAGAPGGSDALESGERGSAPAYACASMSCDGSWDAAVPQLVSRVAREQSTLFGTGLADEHVMGRAFRAACALADSGTGHVSGVDDSSADFCFETSESGVATAPGTPADAERALVGQLRRARHEIAELEAEVSSVATAQAQERAARAGAALAPRDSATESTQPALLAPPAPSPRELQATVAQFAAAADSVYGACEQFNSLRVPPLQHCRQLQRQGEALARACREVDELAPQARLWLERIASVHDCVQASQLQARVQDVERQWSAHYDENTLWSDASIQEMEKRLDAVRGATLRRRKAAAVGSAAKQDNAAFCAAPAVPCT